MSFCKISSSDRCVSASGSVGLVFLGLIFACCDNKDCAAKDPLKITEIDREHLQSWESSPKTRQDLDAKTREDFDKLHGRIEEVRQKLEAAYEANKKNYTLNEAAETIRRRSTEKEQQLHSLDKKVDQYLAASSAAQKKAYTLQGKVAYCEAMSKATVDAELAPLASFYARKIISSVREQVAKNPDEADKIDRPQLPPAAFLVASIKEMPNTTAADDVKIIFVACQQYADEVRAEVQQLEGIKELPREIGQYVEDKMSVQVDVVLSSSYLQTQAKNAEIESLENEYRSLQSQASKIWPRWDWAVASPEVRQSIEKSIGVETAKEMLANSAVRGRGRLLIILNIVVLAIAAVVCVVFFRRRWLG